MKITFFGGAESVTGANYLCEHEGVKFLVDCGLFQGSRFAEVLNYEKFPYDPGTINALILTHSHTDHMGRIPKLYKENFRGKIYATAPTAAITKIALPDNYRLIMDEAVRDGHEPLFTMDDVSNSYSLFESYFYNEIFHVGKNVSAVFHDAGHILGSAIVEIRWVENGGTKKVYFSGDLGNSPSPLLNDRYQPKDADYVVVESAYGKRNHEDKQARRSILANAIVETVKNGGIAMIPSFAIERTQEILYELHQLLISGIIPKVPIFLDSPTAIEITNAYKDFTGYLNNKAIEDFDNWGGLFNFPSLRYTKTVDESKSINEVEGSKIIIAGSGMSVGGRILHHEKRYLSDPKSTIIFVGYQVNNSLGRKILDGASEVSIFGETVPVRCRIVAIGGYSSHADQNALGFWVNGTNSENKLKKIFIVQGEEDSAIALADFIKKNYQLEAVVPKSNESFELS